MNDTKVDWRRVITFFAVRIVGGIVAIGTFFAGLWSVWSDPIQGFSLMSLGAIVGVIFGRYPSGTK